MFMNGLVYSQMQPIRLSACAYPPCMYSTHAVSAETWWTSIAPDSFHWPQWTSCSTNSNEIHAVNIDITRHESLVFA